MLSLSQLILTFLLVISCFHVAHAGTWLSFNDFAADDGMGEPTARLGDVMTKCKETQKRLAKRAQMGERVIRAQQENEAICRFIMRMGR
uniref:Secreted protein n=1 Tax=Caenorhabditis tropicalis TaxID=1561998 RepID=A0A1I7TG71_9PELO